MQFIPVTREEYFKILSTEDVVVDDAWTNTFPDDPFMLSTVTIVWKQRYGTKIGKVVSDGRGLDQYYLTKYFWNNLQKNKEN